MIIHITETINLVFHRLKAGVKDFPAILDWIPSEILDFCHSENFFFKESNKIEVHPFSISRFIALIRLLQTKHKNTQNYPLRADNLEAFLHFVRAINGGQVTNSGVCVLTSKFFNELINGEKITKQLLIDKLEFSNDKAISLYFDGGKPNVSKGLHHHNWLREGRLKFLVYQNS